MKTVRSIGFLQRIKAFAYSGDVSKMPSSCKVSMTRVICSVAGTQVCCNDLMVSEISRTHSSMLWADLLRGLSTSCSRIRLEDWPPLLAPDRSPTKLGGVSSLRAAGVLSLWPPLALNDPLSTVRWPNKVNNRSTQGGCCLGSISYSELSASFSRWVLGCMQEATLLQSSCRKHNKQWTKWSSD